MIFMNCHLAEAEILRDRVYFLIELINYFYYIDWS